MHVDAQQVLTLSQDLWTNQLGLSVQTDAGSDATNGEKTWSSWVRVSGSWQGAIVLECPESIVRHAAVMLFHTDGETAGEDEMRDAARELADLVGSRMRSLLPDDSKLSRPSLVVDVEDQPFGSMNGLGNFQLNCEGRPVRIAVYEAEPEAVEG